VIAEVARAHGRELPAVWNDPYALTRYAYLQLRQSQAIEEWKRMYDRLDAADLTTLATHAPAALKDVRDRVQASAASRPPGLELSRRMQIGAQMVAEMTAIEQALAAQGRSAWVPSPDQN
jgi:hypothetical protein